MESAGVEDLQPVAGEGDNVLRHRKPTAEEKLVAPDFKPLVVVEFSPKVLPSTVNWVAEKLQLARRLGGAELLIRRAKDEHDRESVLYLGASSQRLLLAAELMELKKTYQDGSLREVSLEDLHCFKNSDDVDRFLTMAEQQRIVRHEMDTVRANREDGSVPGCPRTVPLYHGQAIIPRLLHKNVILQIFPLHNKADLKVLGAEWYRALLQPQPMEKIQSYFGDTVAIYFAFLGFYTMALIPPALIGILSSALSPSGPLKLDFIVFFSIFNLVWATIFLESWKRHCSTLAYTWGTLNTESFEEARAAYHGELGVNPITGRLEPHYPKWKRVAKFYGISLPIVFVCLFLAFLVMLVYFWMEDLAISFHKTHNSRLSTLLLHVPTIIYAVVIVIMNGLYRALAKALNDWENHRLESAYENHLITKLVLFDFVNCFLSLFYVAFYMQDMALLKSHLAALLITQQVLGQAQETLLPYLMYKWRKKGITRRYSLHSEAARDGELSEQTEIESSKDTYPGILDDYLELFLQFGYVFLFSAVFPSAAFWALLNNFTEIRSDAFKLCRVFQRPFSQPTAGIGAWLVAFELMSAMAVMTNCALVALSPHTISLLPSYGDVGIVLTLVLAEHALLFVKLVIAYVIPDEPEWVQAAVSKVEYQAKNAWRRQRMMDAGHKEAPEKSAGKCDLTDDKNS